MSKLSLPRKSCYVLILYQVLKDLIVHATIWYLESDQACFLTKQSSHVFRTLWPKRSQITQQLTTSYGK